MTRNTNVQIDADHLPEQQDKHTRPQSAEIIDPVFEETYIAHLIKKASRWHGWIPDVPEVKCEAKSKTELLKTLVSKLGEALVAEEEAWEKQFEADVKAGKLNHLAEKAVKNYREGKCYNIKDLQKLL